jgi:hypothetical protein
MRGQGLYLKPLGSTTVVGSNQLKHALKIILKVGGGRIREDKVDWLLPRGGHP